MDDPYESDPDPEVRSLAKFTHRQDGMALVLYGCAIILASILAWRLTGDQVIVILTAAILSALILATRKLTIRVIASIGMMVIVELRESRKEK